MLCSCSLTQQLKRFLTCARSGRYAAFRCTQQQPAARSQLQDAACQAKRLSTVSRQAKRLSTVSRIERFSRFAYRHRRPHHRRPAEAIAAGTSRTCREGNRSPLADLVCACSAGLTWLHESCCESASGRAGEWRSSSSDRS